MGFFNQNLFLGIDIGTTSLKIAELRKTGGKIELSNYGILEKYGHLERINDAIQTSTFKLLEESTALLLKQLIRTAKLDAVTSYMTLPGFSGFVSLIDFPEMKEKELAKAIRYQAGQYIPMSLEEMTLDWQIIEQENDRMQVLLMAVPTEIVQRYVKTAALAKLNLRGLELETVAIARLLGIKEKSPAIVVDIGGRTTSISVIDKGSLRQTHNIDTAGGDLTQVISSGLGISPLRAEEVKKTSGLDSQYQGEIALLKLLTPLLDVIKREIEKSINNYYLQSKRKVEKIILTGGGANLNGLDKYYSDSLLMPVVKGDPFSWGLIAYHPNLAPIIKEIGTNLTAACAVAFKNL
ncbi:type IV pilus assembly protein PilM [Candidatus Parcubacteria bacterium]|nr:type IV pilus assembly protein PilM [Candidatus Parcubacteria bacterium]